MTVTWKDCLAFVFLPGIKTRAKDLGLNFGYLAHLMALAFRSARLLPPQHPYLFPSQVGTFGIRHVLAAAAGNLKGGVRNIDQYLIYGIFLAGVAFLILQFVLVIAMLATHTAEAAIPFVGMFETVNPTDDIAFMMLDKVFQIPGLFNSQLAPANAAAITPFTAGLHAMFGFYSAGMLIVAFLIVLYYIFAIAIETAQTGVPFGERFQSIFVPIRLILAILMLVPIAYGLNAGQHFTLHLAYWGSSFATNSWLLFNQQAGTNPLGLSDQEMVAKPKVEEITNILNFFYLVQTCRSAYGLVEGKDIKPYFVKPPFGPDAAQADEMIGQDFPTALAFFNNGDITVTFGEKNASYTKHTAGVKPYCGQITIPIKSKDVAGIKDLYDVYYTFIRDLWNNGDLIIYGQKVSRIKFREKCSPAPCDLTVFATVSPWDAEDDQLPGSGFYSDMQVTQQANFTAQMEAAITTIRTNVNPDLQMSAQILDMGWGGAGVWFNTLADFNGALTDAALMIPTPTKYPAVMEHVLRKKNALDVAVSQKERFAPTNATGGDSMAKYWSEADLGDPSINNRIAGLMDAVYQNILSVPSDREKTKNALGDMFNFIFGMYGLYDLRENNDVHPLAKMSALGKSIISKTISYIGVGFVMAGVGGFASGIEDMANVGKAFDMASTAIVSFAMIGLTIGFILFYLIPFMPFLYFFFAVGKWVKAIFEAMVGIPLWALAHLHIDGEGIPGPSAVNGYLILLEILLRPILILFGFVASLTAFSAMATVLETIFTLVVSNVAGYNPFDAGGAMSFPDMDNARTAIDEFFYTVMYAILLYMMATSCFKLIDLIPNQLIRWFGNSVASFADKAPDPAENLVRYTAYAGYTFSDEVAGAVKSLGHGTSTATGEMVGAALKKSSVAERLKGFGKN
jgi:conjugal transfer/type IV secretion protein DotA/TraY